jgi:hypothetical protein
MGENNRVLFIEGALIDTVSFLSDRFESSDNIDVLIQSSWLQPEVILALETIRQKETDRDRTIVSNYEWLRQWAEHQNSIDVNYHYIEQPEWRYEKDRNIEQFDQPTYARTHETLRVAY